jgi:hypothetical protein
VSATIGRGEIAMSFFSLAAPVLVFLAYALIAR